MEGYILEDTTFFGKKVTRKKPYNERIQAANNLIKEINALCEKNNFKLGFTSSGYRMAFKDTVTGKMYLIK